MEQFITRSVTTKKKGSSSLESQKSKSSSDSDVGDSTISRSSANNDKANIVGAGGDGSANKSKNKRRKYSIVWKYTKKSNDRKLAKCITCGKEYKTNGNTSNLSDHLKRFHPNLIENDDGNLEDSEPLASVGSTSSSSTSTSARSSVRSISPFFKRGIHYDESSQRKKHLDRAVLEMITSDFQPFTIVRDVGFNKLVTLLDPRYKLPSTYTLSEKLLKEAYLEEYTKLQNELSKIDYVGITTDSWTSIATESYLTVTCHYVDAHFHLKSCVLSTKPLPNGLNHTSENIAETLKAIFDEWQISDKVTSIVTDNAANMIKACSLLKRKHLPCYAHTLNLVVQDNLKLVQQILKKKDIVTFFKSSPLAMDTFKNEQNVKEPLKLIQEVPTRWNSTFYMIQRIIKTNSAVGCALLKLRRAPQPLTVDDMAILADIEKVLNCFEEATRKISGNDYVTISLIIPITFGIQNFLNRALTELSTEERKTFCKNLLASVDKRLAPYELRTVPRLGTILDPRFKKEGFRTKENALATATLLENDMYSLSQKLQRDLNLTTDSLNVDVDTVSSPASTSGSALFVFLQQRLEEKVKSVTADMIITKRQYLERQNAADKTDPLAFWKITGNELSPLNLLSKKFFCVPTTSVDSERTFSSAGFVISDRRSRLKPDKVNMILFLHKNM